MPDVDDAKGIISGTELAVYPSVFRPAESMVHECQSYCDAGRMWHSSTCLQSANMYLLALEIRVQHRLQVMLAAVVNA